VVLPKANDWPGEAKNGAMTWRRIHADLSSMPFDDLLAQGESDPGSRVIRPTMKPLEQDEDTLQVLRLDAYAVVAHAESPHAVIQHGGDVHLRRLVEPVKFDAVGDQVLKQLT